MVVNGLMLIKRIYYTQLDNSKELIFEKKLKSNLMTKKRMMPGVCYDNLCN